MGRLSNEVSDLAFFRVVSGSSWECFRFLAHFSFKNRKIELLSSLFVCLSTQKYLNNRKDGKYLSIKKILKLWAVTDMERRRHGWPEGVSSGVLRRGIPGEGAPQRVFKGSPQRRVSWGFSGRGGSQGGGAGWRWRTRITLDDGGLLKTLTPRHSESSSVIQCHRASWSRWRWITSMLWMMLVGVDNWITLDDVDETDWRGWHWLTLDEIRW